MNILHSIIPNNQPLSSNSTSNSFTKIPVSPNETFTILPNVKLLIGLGCQKCGSTFFQHELLDTFKVITNNKYSFNINYIPAIHEMYYWGYKGKLCNWNNYLKLFIKDNSSQYIGMENLILSEKTPRYLRMYQSAYSLSHYAHSYDISLWAVLRNPIRRVWSAYWGAARLNSLYNDKQKRITNIHNESDMNHIQLMNDHIQNDIDTFHIRYPLFDKLLSMIQIKNINQSDNNDINETYIAKLYVSASDAIPKHHHPHDVPNIITSCYYPQLLVWNYMFNDKVVKDFNLSENIKLYDRFKVIQSEYMFGDTKNTIKELMCWLLHYNDNRCTKLNDVLSNTNVYTKLFANNTKKAVRAPKIIDIMDLSVAKSLQNIYRHCNQRLYWFLQTHPQFVLKNTLFNRFD